MLSYSILLGMCCPLENYNKPQKTSENIEIYSHPRSHKPIQSWKQSQICFCFAAVHSDFKVEALFHLFLF